MKTPEEQIQNWCKHFNGAYHDTCQAGIAYRDVRVEGRLPCLKDKGVSHTCPHALFPSTEEAAEQAARKQEAIASALDLLHRGFCPVCKNRVEEKRQVGRSVYALPCWHRLYQGRLRKENT